MHEINYAHDPEDQGEPDGDQGIESPGQNPVGDYLGEDRQIHRSALGP